MIAHRTLVASLTVNLLCLAVIAGGWTRKNVETTFNDDIDRPVVAKTAFQQPLADLTGNVTIGEHVYIAPFASVRGDEGQPLYIGDDSNVQDGVVLHGLETREGGHEIETNEVEVAGKKYSVYIGRRVSLAHQSQVHGPAAVGDDTFIGMQALVFKAEVGDHVVVEPGATVMGVKIAPGHYVPAGAVVTTQAAADALPVITDGYPFKQLNASAVQVNKQLAEGYNRRKVATGVQEEGS